MLAPLETLINSLLPQCDQLSDERRRLLTPISDHLRQRRAQNLPLNLVFICTHNSRRSHLSQVWAQTAAAWFSVANVHTFSGGTEVTAFHPNAVAALQAQGFQITRESDGANPRYRVVFAAAEPLSAAFSKRYDDPPNPRRDFAAVLTCSEADQHCPHVHGAVARFPLPYRDPKVADGSDAAAHTYRERADQIAVEMLFLFGTLG